MREQCREFVRLAAEALEPAGPVYEFGAFQVAGQEAKADLRSLFPGREYVGCDMRSGAGVDRVEDLERLTLSDGVAGCVLAIDTLEHVRDPFAAARELLRIVRSDGLLLVAVPMYFKIHDHPSDYWRFTPAALAVLLEGAGSLLVASQGPARRPHTVFAAASPDPERAGDLERLGAHLVPRLARRQRGSLWRQIRRARRLWRESARVHLEPVQRRAREGEGPPGTID